MVQKLRERSNGEGGFTLVELLVVMLILGLLAAIAIPSFFNQRDKATDADAKSSVRTAQTAMETYATDNGGAYTGASAADLKAIEETLNEAGTRLAEPTIAAGGEGYTVSVTSDRTSGPTFSIARASNGTLTYVCDSPSNGGCPAGATDTATTANWGE